MWPYWFIYFLPGYFALKRPIQISSFIKNKSWDWNFWLILLILMIGLRFEVGGDWDPYNFHILMNDRVSFQMLDLRNEPLFLILVWLGAKWGGIYLFNLISAAIFCSGLFGLCQHFPRPWLCLTIAIPYMLIVVSMGYSRQAAALGAFMFGLLALEEGNLWKYMFWILFGSAFHKSLIFMLALSIIFKKNLNFKNLLILGLGGFLFIYYLRDFFWDYYQGYIVQEYNSSGAYLRCGLNGYAGGVYLLLNKRFKTFSENAHRLYFVLSLLSLIALMLLSFLTITTAIDRLSLYLLPLQCIVLGNLPDVLGSHLKPNRGWVLIILIFYGFVEYVWLCKSLYSSYWLPYRFYLWELLKS